MSQFSRQRENCFNLFAWNSGPAGLCPPRCCASAHNGSVYASYKEMVRGSGRLPCVVVTGVNPAEDAGDTSPNILVGGTSTGISLQYYYVLSDIADQYWLPSVRSASSRFHSAIRRHQFASVRKADSRLTRLVPPALNSR